MSPTSIFTCLLVVINTIPIVSLKVTNSNRLIFVINSQPDPYHASVAQETHDILVSNLQDADVKNVNVILTHNSSLFSYKGAWTYLPVIEAVHQEFDGQYDFLIFLEENAGVNITNLAETLSYYSPDEELHVGYALEDFNRVIMHYYDEPGFIYAHPDAGFVLTSALASLISKKVKYLGSKDAKFPKEFSIDPQYELAKAINHLQDDSSHANAIEIPLVHDNRFCIKYDQQCAIYPRNVTCDTITDKDVIQMSKMTLFAVKTCGIFHQERLSVLEDTWKDPALNLLYFSEVKDPVYSTLVLEGVRNTEKGHCGKTEAIIKYFGDLEDYEWLVIADDDTVLGVRKILGQLWCYGRLRDNEYNNGQGTLLGQRYGYKISYGGQGYDYITGGGGMILDKAAAKTIVESGQDKNCSCPSPDFPDDKFLGICSANIELNLVHSSRFHQCKPEDYHPDLLTGLRGGPVSFHKYIDTDPRATYNKYFRDSDIVLVDSKQAQRELRVLDFHQKHIVNDMILLVYLFPLFLFILLCLKVQIISLCK